MRTHAAGLGAALFLGGTLAAGVASADGGTPRAFEMIAEPGNPDDLVLRSDFWGFYRTRDGGKTWSWTCAEAYGVDSKSPNHLGIAVATGGRVLVARYGHGVEYTDDGCTWSSLPAFAGLYVSDVRATLNGVYVVTSPSANGDASFTGYVYVSSDGGSEFSPKGSPLPPNFGARQFAVAPSDPKRWYVSGRELEATPGTLMRSEDEGATWDATTVPLTDPFMGLRIAGVDPANPDVVFLWGDTLEDPGGVASPDQLWVSDDGGKTVRQILESPHDLPGFAFSPDGTDVYVGGIAAGLLHARVADVLAQGQSAFQQALTGSARPTDKDRRVWGLYFGPNGLTAGVDNFTRAGVPAFSYGSWIADDHDFSKLMDICDPDYAACAPSTKTGSVCASVFSSPGGYEPDFIQNSGRCDPRPGDAGFRPDLLSPSATSGKDSSGCAVALSSKTATGGVFFLMSALGAFALVRRRSRKR
ncbi:MAG TPA: hypothetical protein VHE30_13045 [Polyangiaceae bacterium]|nr:hypothetical protein [Polyangiaceae bacterium]